MAPEEHQVLASCSFPNQPMYLPYECPQRELRKLLWRITAFPRDESRLRLNPQQTFNAEFAHGSLHVDVKVTFRSAATVL